MRPQDSPVVSLQQLTDISDLVDGDPSNIAPESLRKAPELVPATADPQPTATVTPLRPLIVDRFKLYETRMRFYIVASNQSDTRHRVLKIDRQAEANEPLIVTEDPTIYSEQELDDLIGMIKEGNKGTGGFSTACDRFYGIIGFTRFTGGWYMVLIKERQEVALIGGHYIYHCSGTLLLPITRSDSTAEEIKALASFQQLDLSKNFYFSYTYDLTNTLQVNLTGTRLSMPRDQQTRVGPPTAWGYNDKFVWNHYLLNSAFSGLQDGSNWILPVIHGFVDQGKVSIFGRTVYITLIGRRSRHFAGARFLKRGANDLGFVANDVETEQIVTDVLTTSLHDVRSKDGETRINPRYTSFVQHRGSIPLSWTQDNSGLQAKPPIEISNVDPYFTKAALHFDDLMCRYGTPIIVLNLIKQRNPREQILLPEYSQCIAYLNQFLPEPHRIQYRAFDMAAAYRKKDDVLSAIEDIAQEVLDRTGFFHSGPEAAGLSLHEGATRRKTPLLQQGICRSNCVDCLDRTNAAQFSIGKVALGHQLRALGVLEKPRVVINSDAWNLLTEMYHDHGDTLALQYGGSHLVNTIHSYDRHPQWSSHSRDMVENLKRYYSNSFVDADKQAAIDRFLGIGSDERLEMLEGHPTARPYRSWFTPSHLEPRMTVDVAEERLNMIIQKETDYWLEYYRPRRLTDLGKRLAFHMNSTIKLAPFRHSMETREQRDIQRGGYRSHRLTNIEEDSADDNKGSLSRWVSRRKSVGSGLQASTRRLRGSRYRRQSSDSGNSDSPKEDAPKESTSEKLPPLTTSHGLAMRLLKPQVKSEEADEYLSYVNQFGVMSTPAQPDLSEADLLLYEKTARIARGLSTTKVLHTDLAFYKATCSIMTDDPSMNAVY